MARAIGIAIGAMAAAAGAAMLALAVPVAGAGLAEVPGNAVLERLHHEAPAAPALRRLIRSREISMAWRETARAATDLALARMMLGERGAGAEPPGRQLALAEAELVKGLGLAPMNPYGWMRLVRVRMTLRHPGGEIAPALGLAIHTGPRETRLEPLVVQAGLQVWSALGRGDRDRVGDRVRRAWRADALRASALAAGVGRTDLLARLVFGPDDPVR